MNINSNMKTKTCTSNSVSETSNHASHPSINKVVICGGGNAAHVAVGMFSTAGVEVDLFMSYGNESDKMIASLNESKDHNISVAFESASNPKNKVMYGTPKKVSKYPSEVIPGADLVLIIAPANSHEPILNSIIPHLSQNVILGATPAPGGFNMLAKKCLKDAGKDLTSVTLFGVACLPWVCRIERFGESVKLSGTKSLVDVNVIPVDATDIILNILNNLYIDTTFRSRGNFLHTTLYPHNCIIHPGIMYGLFERWDPQKLFLEAPLFYQNMDKNTAEVLEGLSDDVQNIAAEAEKKLGMELSVPTLKELMLDIYPNSIANKESVETIFKTNSQYDGLTAPMCKAKDEESKTGIDTLLIPHFEYRYLTEDLPHGLCVLKGIAEILDVKTPTMNKVIIWGQNKIKQKYLDEDGKMTGPDIEHSGCPQRFGIHTVEALKNSVI